MENKEHIYKNLLLKTIKTCYVKYQKNTEKMYSVEVINI